MPAGDDGASLRGLRLEFRTLADDFDASARSVERARTAALFVPAGERPAVGIEPGPFRATWSGELVLESRQRVYFSVARCGYGRGRDADGAGDGVLRP